MRRRELLQSQEITDFIIHPITGYNYTDYFNQIEYGDQYTTEIHGSCRFEFKPGNIIGELEVEIYNHANELVECQIYNNNGITFYDYSCSHGYHGYRFEIGIPDDSNTIKVIELWGESYNADCRAKIYPVGHPELAYQIGGNHSSKKEAWEVKRL